MSRSLRRLFSNRELRGVGLVRLRDGIVVDNRDGFYNEAPDYIREYDSRTTTVIEKETLSRLMDLITADQLTALQE